MYAGVLFVQLFNRLQKKKDKHKQNTDTQSTFLSYMFDSWNLLIKKKEVFEQTAVLAQTA